jgi:hypothetical protein
LLIFPSGVRSPSDFFCSHRPGLRTALGHTTNWAETLQDAYNSFEKELVELRTATLEACQAVEEGEAQAGSSLASRRTLHLGVQKALDVVCYHYEVNLEAVASGYIVPEGVEDEAAMEQADALAADAAEALTEAFSEFLFPDAADGDEPQA